MKLTPDDIPMEARSRIALACRNLANQFPNPELFVLLTFTEPGGVICISRSPDIDRQTVIKLLESSIKELRR